MLKTIKILVGTSLAVSLATAIATPAKANPETNEPQVISQLLGHDRYKDEPQMNGDDYLMGRVVGRAGTMVSVLLDDGTLFSTSSTVAPGNNVLVSTNEKGNYFIVDAAHPTWIYKLVEDYNVKPW
jgi:hypothetical protein